MNAQRTLLTDPDDQKQTIRLTERCQHLKKAAMQHYQLEKGFFFSVSGRTELAGNHTDHNHGLILAASVSLDTLGFAQATDEPVIRLYDLGYQKEFIVHLDDLSIKADAYYTTQALIRGVTAFFQQNNKKIGGFTAVTHSTVPAGGGLSSSASFEGFIALILNFFFNNRSLDALFMARAGQYAENHHFNKPCGLMDQLACLYGGTIKVDFASETAPVITSIPVDFSRNGYQLCIVDTKSDHQNLTEDYAAIPQEMKAVARFFHQETLRQVDQNLFYQQLTLLREHCGDRPVLRAIHFFEENRRVERLYEALEAENLPDYFRLVQESGHSSALFLQNLISFHRRDMALALALALTDHFTQGKGIARLHGGGFAGAIQAYIATDLFDSYKVFMESFFGRQAVTALSVRNQGALIAEGDHLCLL